MEVQLTTSNIITFVTLVGLVFSVYLHFRKPQDNMEIKQAVVDKEIDSKASILAQKEMENKANILAEQFRMRSEATDKRFEAIVQDNKEAMALAQNHTHTIQVQVETLTKFVNDMNLAFTKEFTKLSTLLSERLPQKQL